MTRNKKREETQTTEELEKIQEESEKQERPDQKSVITVSKKLRKRLHNLPDPTNPPLGYDEHKAFDKVFPYINIPALHPKDHGDTVIFNDPKASADKLYLGDNLEVLRTLKSRSIDLIYIDPPFFSGRNYNVIWGDSNEVRTFEDIWEGGITSYLIWLNARLWEMRRTLKNTGSIYVHCDWHASHYIKTEMDKIFGYENFRNEIVWKRTSAHSHGKTMGNVHDVIFYYTKSNKFNWNQAYQPYSDKYIESHYYRKGKGGRLFRTDNLIAPGSGYVYKWKGVTKNWRAPKAKMVKWDKEGRIVYTKKGTAEYKRYLDEMPGVPIQDIWDDIPPINSQAKERLGYPTQKPELLLERIIETSSNKKDVIADFFCGGGTTLAIGMKKNRRFIGCDSSRVAISVTLNRLVKVGEEMSGVMSNISVSGDGEVSLKKGMFDEEKFQLKLQTKGITEKVPNIEVHYLGVYPVEKFQNLEQEEFINFVLTAYGASRNTGKGLTHGYKPPAQQEPIYIGPADPNKSVGADEIKEFFEETKTKVEPNKMIRAKIVAWRFSRQVLQYIKILQRYSEKHNLPIKLEAIPLDSKEFRQRILQRMPDVEEAELFLRFSKPPVIGDIKAKKIGKLEYEFEAVDAISTNEDGWLVNCQWDFDYQEGHFSAHKDCVLSREKKKDKRHGHIFEAILKARHKFVKEGEYTVACKVQDNLAGESIISIKISATQ